MPKVTRLGDLCTGHGCYVPRPSNQGSPDVFCNGIEVHRLTDSWSLHGCIDCTPHGGQLASSSNTVFVNGLGCGRIGDSVSCGSTVAQGSPDVECGG